MTAARVARATAAPAKEHRDEHPNEDALPHGCAGQAVDNRRAGRSSVGTNRGRSEIVMAASATPVMLPISPSARTWSP